MVPDITIPQTLTVEPNRGYEVTALVSNDHFTNNFTRPNLVITNQAGMLIESNYLLTISLAPFSCKLIRQMHDWLAVEWHSRTVVENHCYTLLRSALCNACGSLPGNGYCPLLGTDLPVCQFAVGERHCLARDDVPEVSLSGERPFFGLLYIPSYRHVLVMQSTR